MADAVKVLLNGATGRMGTALAALAADDPAVRLIAGIGRVPERGCDIGCPIVETPETAGAWVREADVVVDFSSPELLGRLLVMYVLACLEKLGRCPARRPRHTLRRSCRCLTGGSLHWFGGRADGQQVRWPDGERLTLPVQPHMVPPRRPTHRLHDGTAAVQLRPAHE